MKDILGLLTTRVEKELNSKNCVIDIFKTQNFNKLKHDDGTYWHNQVQIRMSDTSDVVIRDNYTCIGCNMKAEYIVIAKNIHSNNPTQKYIPFYYIIDRTTGELKKLTKDHIIPRSLGGSNRMSNYQCMCEVCNNKKSNVLFGLDIDKLIKQKIEEDRSRIGDILVYEFKKSSFLLRILGLTSFVNNILEKLYKGKI